jgi:hypothetical protein
MVPETSVEKTPAVLDEAKQEASNTSVVRDAIGDLEEFIEKTGYAYDKEQDIFYSVLDPWQRKYGYCSLYDDAAAPLGMVFHSEPIRFEYGGKRWLIEFWKGQYGITAGAEIGLYNTTWPDIDLPGFNGTFYYSADDGERLHMAYTLFKDEQAYFRREGEHWWLTGFRLGDFAKPEDLTMEASITFRETEMLRAFVNAMTEAGYEDSEIDVSGETVSFVFSTPRTEQPITHKGLIARMTLARNRRFVRDFKKITEGCDNIAELLTTLKAKSPPLYTLATQTGRYRSAYSTFDLIRKYVILLN